MRKLYRSANGDAWFLVRDRATGRPLVRHQPNAASGGRPADIDIGEFLARGPQHPQHEALLRLIAGLADEAPNAVRSGN